MTNDPIQYFEKYKNLFFEHILDMERNETGKSPQISNTKVRFIGKEACGAEDQKEFSHYHEMIYEVSFNTDLTFYAKTILNIEKWVDVSSCKMLEHIVSDNKYLFEIRTLVRDSGD